MARLESWKAIAQYLDRTVRTVQRWEQLEGMPVKRHHHARSASVYARQSELDEWQSNHETARSASAPLTRCPSCGCPISSRMA
jgi:hypothetical protein